MDRSRDLGMAVGLLLAAGLLAGCAPSDEEMALLVLHLRHHHVDADESMGLAGLLGRAMRSQGFLTTDGEVDLSKRGE